MTRRAELRAVSFDYWDTLYNGAAIPERIEARRAHIRTMLEAVGVSVSEEKFLETYRASGREADRWWREEHRGYTTADRIRWLLAQYEVARPDDCEHIRAACEAVDATLLLHPPPVLPGAREMLERVHPLARLAILSDTGFASGRAQDRLLEHNGLLHFFAATIYSMDIGYAKPHHTTFEAVARALDVTPGSVIHIGDNERTDVQGALAAGMRAIRLDVVRQGGPSAAEFVATSFAELSEYLGRQAAPEALAAGA